MDEQVSEIFSTPYPASAFEVYPMHGGMVGQQDDKNGPGGSGFLKCDDPSYTLLASSRSIHGVVAAATDPSASHLSAMRRLTPVEYERLQGFPEGWTDEQADIKRYKQMGNAVAVPVVEWVIAGVVAAD